MELCPEHRKLTFPAAVTDSWYCPDSLNCGGNPSTARCWMMIPAATGVSIFTQAETVNAIRPPRDAEGSQKTLSFTPSKCSALPLFPVVHVGPETRASLFTA